MGLARAHFDRAQFEEWSRDQLIDALIEAKTQLVDHNRTIHSQQERIEDMQEPWL